MEAGDVLDGRYEVGKLLGKGGMGRLWKATETETGRTVAVKELRLDEYTLGRMSESERIRYEIELTKRFKREGVILADLNHPRITRLLHSGYLDGAPYLVMEFVDGDDLRSFLDRRRPFPFDAAVSVAVDIAEALEHAHANGVVHRDLKPHNVMVAYADGAAKVIDFGIAHLTDPYATRYTELGATPGSVGYMAPEQLEGERNLSEVVDFYAFGCVLFELLTGRQPFEEKPDRNRSIQHLKDLPPRLRSINPAIPQEIDDLVWDLLAKDAADRPRSAGEVLDVLRPFLPKPGDPAPDPEMYPDPTKRHRLGTASADSAHTSAAPRPAARRSHRRSGGWLSHKQFAGQIVLARAELRDGPGVRCAELQAMLPKAVKDWGPRLEDVLEARLVCAHAALLEGRTTDAEALYEEVADEGDPPDRLVLEAELGITVCRMREGDYPGAFNGWRSAVRGALALPPPMPELLARRCREVGEELAEKGYRAEVAPHLDQLPDM
ncbi:serine/threonine-protein kinase [Streptomyces niveiscabiei]|uniref:Serine/threonine-protein kinase n=1 Tax=Streptomyces niveiscabiei TaxID=164115 RepID=A0ABW9I0L4_9ACTN